MLKHRHVVITAMLMFCWAITGCRGPEKPSHSVLRRGLGGDPATLDPGTAVDSFSYQVIQDLFEGLTAEAADGEAIPAAASSWEVDSNGTTYTFHIRPDASWSNGEPLLANHFVQAWRRVLDPKFASGAADDLSLIAGARRIIAGIALPEELDAHATDDLTLVIKLERPAPFFPGLLSHTSAFPLYSTRADPLHDSSKWVSNGPYILSSWQAGTRIQLSKNLRYWDASHVSIARVEYQISSDENAQYARYRAGQLDMTDVVPASALEFIKQTISNELVVAPYLGTAYYGLNLKSPPLSNSLELRESLSMAIDRSRLVASMGFGQTPAYSFVPPKIWNYQPQSVAWADLDASSRVAEARRLYSIAGYSKTKPLHVRVLINSNSTIRQTAIQIAAMWKDVLGVETELEEQEYKVFLESRHDPARFDIARLAWVADFNDAVNFLDAFRRHSANNDESYDDDTFEALMERATTSRDIEQRRELLQSAERELVNKYPVVPLYYYVSKRLVKPYLHGVAPSPLDRVRSKDLSFSSEQ